MPAGSAEKLIDAAYEAAIWLYLGCPKVARVTIEDAIIEDYETSFGSKGNSREKAFSDSLPQEENHG